MVQLLKTQPHYFLGIIVSLITIMISVVIFILVHEVKTNTFNEIPQIPPTSSELRKNVIIHLRNVEQHDEKAQRDIAEIKNYLITKKIRKEIGKKDEGEQL